MKDYNRSSFPIVLWRDKNLIVALSFVDSVCKFDLNEIVLGFLLSANASFYPLHKPFNVTQCLQPYFAKGGGGQIYP